MSKPPKKTKAKPKVGPPPASNVLPFEEVRDRAAKLKAARSSAPRPSGDRGTVPPFPPPSSAMLQATVSAVHLREYKTVVFHDEGKISLSHRHEGREVFTAEYDVSTGLALGKQIIEAVRRSAEFLEAHDGEATSAMGREQQEERLKGIFKRDDVSQAVIEVAALHQVDVNKMFAYDDDDTLSSALGHLWAIFMHQERPPQLVKSPGWMPIPRWWLAELWQVPEVTVQYLSETYELPPDPKPRRKRR